MIEKTKGIVLHQLKYSDSGVVVQVYTRKFGRLSFLIRGMRKRKSGRHNVFFQPMFILELVIYYKPSREMQVMKDFSVSFSPNEIYNDIRKGSVAIFMGEVLGSVLREESPHEELFDYIEKSVIYFDAITGSFANFHIAFLSGLSSYLGFEPGSRIAADEIYFDMLNGIFVSIPPAHGNYANPEISGILSEFFTSSFDKTNEIPLKGSLRNEVLEVLVRYYSLHLPGLRKIRSLDVLKEVFG